MDSHWLYNSTASSVPKCSIFSRTCHDDNVHAPIARACSDFRDHYHGKVVTQTRIYFSFYLGDQWNISSCTIQSEFRICINKQEACFGSFIYVYDRLYPLVIEDERYTWFRGPVLGARGRSIPFEGNCELPNSLPLVLFNLNYRDQGLGARSKFAMVSYRRHRIYNYLLPQAISWHNAHVRLDPVARPTEFIWITEADCACCETTIIHIILHVRSESKLQGELSTRYILPKLPLPLPPSMQEVHCPKTLRIETADMHPAYSEQNFSSRICRSGRHLWNRKGRCKKVDSYSPQTSNQTRFRLGIAWKVSKCSRCCLDFAASTMVASLRAYSC